RAFRARIADGLALAMTLRAGALDGEEALGCTNAPCASAHLAGDRLGSGLGAGAGAIVTHDGRRHVDLGRLAGEGFLERHFHVVAQISATFATARGATAPPHHVAENVFEYVREAAAGKAATAAHAAIFKGGMTEAIIGCALLRILEAFISLVDFLEFGFAFGIPRIPVGMILHRKLAERALEFLLVRSLLNAESFVVIRLHVRLGQPA